MLTSMGQLLKPKCTMKPLDAIDIIAILILTAGFILIAFGADGWVKAMMGTVIGFYYGRRTEPPNQY